MGVKERRVKQKMKHWRREGEKGDKEEKRGGGGRGVENTKELDEGVGRGGAGKGGLP